MSTTKPTKKSKSKKRDYTDNPRKKIEAGQPWKYNHTFDKDVALKVIEETEKNGTEYGHTINKRLRKAYNLPKV